MKGNIGGAGYDLDYTAEFLQQIDVIPQMQNIQVCYTLYIYSIYYYSIVPSILYTILGY